MESDVPGAARTTAEGDTNRLPPCLLDADGELVPIEHDIEMLYGPTDPHPVALCCPGCGWRAEVRL